MQTYYSFVFCTTPQTPFGHILALTSSVVRGNIVKNCSLLVVFCSFL